MLFISTGAVKATVVEQFALPLQEEPRSRRGTAIEPEGEHDQVHATEVRRGFDREFF